MINFKDSNPRILVIGDLMIDHYLWGSCKRISPEAPVQVIDVTNESYFLGGAGNVVNNLQALGADAEVISVIGKCDVSNKLIELLEDINVNTDKLVIQKNRISSKKSRIISSQQQVVRYDRESTDEIDEKSQKAILNQLKKNIVHYDVILLSDYGKGLLTHKLTESIISTANDHNKRVLVDPKGQDYSKYSGAFLLTPNKKEASEATNIYITDEVTLEKAIKALKNQLNLKYSIITLSEEGVAVYDKDLQIHPTVARQVFDVTGAGDTILASLGFALSLNSNIDSAIKFSNLSAGVVVGKIGAATATLTEIIEYESNLNKSTSDQHIKNWKEISSIVNELKSKNKKIVFTNGCFDILHTGHVKYLEQSKSFGDVLIVGMNSDKSVKSIKGNNRPINAELDRAYILASLEAVDYVVIFDDENPYDLIKLIKPNVLVKGGDYEGKEIIGADIAEDLKLVKFIEGKSTSKIINKIQKQK
ncbi:D-glycero-beta-D-manno-heptose-7-phosphate kinase [Pseudothioglobus sp. nBUS_23]|uniref:D-glycero-beta-D-manno-heptose-7-phosphate kinase n=1 Tax=Pseudothioglobus sp. nBUS_23 TaxID=3395318 RepID=UPI003EBE2980